MEVGGGREEGRRERRERKRERGAEWEERWESHAYLILFHRVGLQADSADDTTF